MEKIVSNPGLQHLAEKVFWNLEMEDLKMCAQINQFCKIQYSVWVNLNIFQRITNKSGSKLFNQQRILTKELLSFLTLNGIIFGSILHVIPVQLSKMTSERKYGNAVRSLNGSWGRNHLMKIQKLSKYWHLWQTILMLQIWMVILQFIWQQVMGIQKLSKSWPHLTGNPNAPERYMPRMQ